MGNKMAECTRFRRSIRFHYYFSLGDLTRLLLLLLFVHIYDVYPSKGFTCRSELYFPEITSKWRRTIGFAPAPRKAFAQARIVYYPNSTAAYSLRRLLLSGDVELNPGDHDSGRIREASQVNKKAETSKQCRHCSFEYSLA